MQTQPGWNHPRVVHHQHIIWLQELSDIGHLAVQRGATALIDEEACGVPRFDRDLGD